MEFFRDVNIDWMAKKWYFLGFSLIVTVAGLLSMFFWHGIPLGVDFKGGTIVYVKFKQDVGPDPIRAAVEKAGVKDARIQRFGAASNHEYIIALEQQQLNESALETGRLTIINALNDSALRSEERRVGKECRL